MMTLKRQVSPSHHWCSTGSTNRQAPVLKDILVIGHRGTEHNVQDNIGDLLVAVFLLVSLTALSNNHLCTRV